MELRLQAYAIFRALETVSQTDGWAEDFLIDNLNSLRVQRAVTDKTVRNTIDFVETIADLWQSEIC